MHIHIGIIRDQNYNSQIDAIHESVREPIRVWWSDKYSIILNERSRLRVSLDTKSPLLWSTLAPTMELPSTNLDSGVSDTKCETKKIKNAREHQKKGHMKGQIIEPCMTR